MAQYLSFGIITRINLDLKGLTLEKVKKDLKNQGVDLDLYESQLASAVWRGELKSEIIERELLAFLKEAYKLLRLYTSLDDDMEVINTLEKNEPEKWYGILNDAGFCNFQEDRYRHKSYLRVQGQNLEVGFQAVSLKMVGKIMMENDGGLFNLLSTALQKQLSHFELAKSLRVYITG